MGFFVIYTEKVLKNSRIGWRYPFKRSWNTWICICYYI